LFIQFFGSDRSISVNDICSHGLSDFFYLTVRSSQFNDPKVKIQKLKSHGLPTHCHLFLYIKREMRDKERKKKQRREIEEIKIKIHPSQF
jgi:hypothetical protein